MTIAHFIPVPELDMHEASVDCVCGPTVVRQEMRERPVGEVDHDLVYEHEPFGSPTDHYKVVEEE